MGSLKTLFILILIAFTQAHAESLTVPVPVISRPAALLEGTERTLTLEQVKSLIPWANDSKESLTNMLKDTEVLAVSDRIEQLIAGMKGVVKASAGKNPELFMRYTLNRAFVISDLMDKEISKEEIGANDVKQRLVLTSIKMALHYHATDIKILSKKELSPYAAYGIEYFNFLIHLNKSIFDATLQYTIARTALEWFQWDLYRDTANAKYAPHIVKINNYLKTLPEKIEDDRTAINTVRQIKKFITTLEIAKVIEDETEEIIGIPVVATIKSDNYLSQTADPNGPILTFITKGTKVQILSKRIKGGWWTDTIKIKILEVEKSDDLESRYFGQKMVPGTIGYISSLYLEQPKENPLAFGQTYHVKIGGIFMSSTCGTVKRLGYRDITMVEDGTIVKVLDDKFYKFRGGMFVLLDSDRFVKVKVLKGSTNKDYAVTDCVGYVNDRLLEPEF